jgi:hypothetical protein
MKISKIKIDYDNWYMYQSLYQITEYKNGAVYKTKMLGYVKKGYATLENQQLSPLSTSLLGKEISILSE